MLIPKKANFLSMSEIDNFFMNQGSIWNSLRKLNDRLQAKNIDYCVVGGLALNLHGYQRLTTDIDILMLPESLQRFKSELVGLGYRLAFLGANKTFYDSDGVRIEILVTGEYPGDGKPKPIAFPDPILVREYIEGLPIINFITLVELKLTSGMTSSGRLKDLADVQELIKLFELPLSFKNDLPEFVKDKYEELWLGVVSENNQVQESEKNFQE